jgi:hypothetical protein
MAVFPNRKSLKEYGALEFEIPGYERFRSAFERLKT